MTLLEWEESYVFLKICHCFKTVFIDGAELLRKIFLDLTIERRRNADKSRDKASEYVAEH